MGMFPLSVFPLLCFLFRAKAEELLERVEKLKNQVKLQMVMHMLRFSKVQNLRIPSFIPGVSIYPSIAVLLLCRATPKSDTGFILKVETFVKALYTKPKSVSNRNEHGLLHIIIKSKFLGLICLNC